MQTAAAPSAAFWRNIPGERFQHRYWRHRGVNGVQRPMLARVASLTLGAVLAVLGALMLVLPGPGILALAAAGALFASESLRIARALDWIELRVRAAWRRVRRRG
jgi:hypothetical protein